MQMCFLLLTLSVLLCVGDIKSGGICTEAEMFENELSLSNFTRNEDDFVLLYPRTFLAGKNETLCVVFESQQTVPALMKLDLKLKRKHYDQEVDLQKGATCFGFYVPVHRMPEVLNADLSVFISTQKTVMAKSYKNLWIYPSADITFIETDRQVYKPGETVLIRLLILNDDMTPAHQPSPKGKLQMRVLNPHGFIVHVWNDFPLMNGFVSFQYHLAVGTTLGTWVIELNTSRITFQVRNYILPQFKIEINAPKAIYVKSSLIFTVCAYYTFGNNLFGNAYAKITHPHNNHFTLSKIQPLEKTNGCTKFKFLNSDLFPTGTESLQNLNIFASVIEEKSNQLSSETFHVSIYGNPYELRILPEANFFQPSLPYKNKVKIFRGFLSDYSAHSAQICYQIAWKHEWNLKQPECAEFQFDKVGQIHFSLLPFKENVKSVIITAKSLNFTQIKATSLKLRRWYSSSGSYLKIERNSKLYTICRAPQLFTIYFTTNRMKIGDDIAFNYVITAGNDILLLKQQRFLMTHKNYVDFQTEIGNVIGAHSKYTKAYNHVDKLVIKFKSPERLLTKGYLLVFFLHRGEIVSNSIGLHVDRCLPMNITAKWIPETVQPGDDAKLVINAPKESTCAVSTVDVANYFLDGTKRLNMHKLIQPFIGQRDFKPNKIDSAQPDDKHGNGSLGVDAFEDFNSVGLGALSNLNMLMKPCNQESASDYSAFYYEYKTDAMNSEFQETALRSYFPATWHWNIGNPTELFKSQSPHSITSWQTNVLCTSKNGLGIANAKILVAKSFFIDFSLPSRMRRNEILNLQVSAFNNYNYSLPIEIILETNGHLVSLAWLQVICVSARGHSSVMFRIQILQTGVAQVKVSGKLAKTVVCPPINYKVTEKIEDIVVKNLTIDFEGQEEIETKSRLICDQEDFNNFTWTFDQPNAVDFVEGSKAISVVIYSDLIGPVAHNLEELISLPTGCGEQLMAVMAPNFLALKYLKAMNILTSYMRKRIIKNLQIGYQRILDYVHKDGSFSAFGYHDPRGSMFLTAFVFRSLAQAKEHIFIDSSVTADAIAWILEQQLENGCFAAVSHVFQDMGGASKENSTSALTSYVMISLLESGYNVSESVRMNAIYCIRGQFNPDMYSLAINTYALYLLGDDVDADHGIRILLLRASRMDEHMWWTCQQSAASGASKSLDVETSSYVLMSLLHKLSNDNLIIANSVVRWLLDQRNAKGGFASSQDTVVALDALARYAVIMNSRHPQATLFATNNDNVQMQAHFSKQDPIKMEEFLFPSNTTSVEVALHGSGCVLTQFILRYNRHQPKYATNKDNEFFALNLEPSAISKNCSLASIQPCFKYKLVEPSMIIMEVSMPSGYAFYWGNSTFDNIVENYTNLKKVEEQSDKLIFYFTDIVANETVCLPFNISQRSNVTLLFDSTITLYQYYNPHRQLIKTYSLPKGCQISQSIVDGKGGE